MAVCCRQKQFVSRRRRTQQANSISQIKSRPRSRDITRTLWYTAGWGVAYGGGQPI